MVKVQRGHDLGGPVVSSLNAVAIYNEGKSTSFEMRNRPFGGVLPALPEPFLVKVISKADFVAGAGLMVVRPKANGASTMKIGDHYNPAEFLQGHCRVASVKTLKHKTCLGGRRSY
jgi:hypothetical protein